MTRVTRRTTTCATCRIEHTCTLFLVSSFDHSSHSTWLKAVHAFITPSPYHPRWAFLSELLDFTFYFSLLFHFLFLSFFLMSDYDDDSMTNNLRNSANGTLVTSDDSSQLTISAHTQTEMEDAQKLPKIPKSECPDVWMRPSKTRVAEVMGIHWRFCCSFWVEFARTPIRRTLVGKTFWKTRC